MMLLGKIDEGNTLTVHASAMRRTPVITEEQNQK